ncbi:MAG: porphobilinogen synthase [Deltaproteobacteria bacterium]|nr:porphobilinogen synthase [Deltaproteobacteria bacterium]
MPFPEERARRLRRTANLRAMARETELKPSDFILPLFVTEGKGIRQEVASMPGVYQLSVDELVKQAKRAHETGIITLILFGIPAYKDEEGSSAWDAKGPVARGVNAIKQKLPEMVVVTDVCMCEYTDHGHCGKLVKREDGSVDVDNDATLDLLAKEALCHARAGADIVAPSDMMDGRVAAIREALDSEGFGHIAILSYAAKYASAFYGPFRDAALSTPKQGDRKSYQMDPANSREALREVRLDLDEGADIVMVKPALSYLDVIARVRESVDVPVAAYNVSGEYAMVKAASKAGWLDEERVMMEILLSIKRAGADQILTYHAVDAAKVLNR